MRHPFRNILAARPKEVRLREIRDAAERLSVTRLTSDTADVLQLNLQEVLPRIAAPRLFGYYTGGGIEYALRELGIFAGLERLGYEDPRVELTGDEWSQTMKIFGGAPAAEQLLMEGRFHRSPWKAPADAVLKWACPEQVYSTITIEWLLLQNPLAGFTPDKPPLPGQRHPGLGLGQEVMEVLFAVAHRLQIDAYLGNAMMYHNACLYAPAFFFFDPRRQAELAAIQEAGHGYSLQDQALAIEGGFLFHGGDERPYRWIGAAMVCPLSGALQDCFQLCGYREAVGGQLQGLQFRFHWRDYQRQRTELQSRYLEPVSGSG